MEMAHIRKRNGKWIAEIRKKDFKKIQKTFLKKSNATNWVQEIEYQMDKNQYEDFSDSSEFTLGDLIKKYRDEITINKKGVQGRNGGDYTNEYNYEKRTSPLCHGVN